MEQTEKKYIFANECPLNEKKKDYFVKFLDYCFKVLALEDSKPIEVYFVEDREDDPDMVTTAYYSDPESKMSIYTYNRAFIDIARSTAHELTHKKQFSLDPDLVTDKHSEGEIEDQANAVAGKIIRGFGKKYPEAYDEEEMEESIDKLKETLKKLTGKEIALAEETQTLSEDNCPICREMYETQCKCGGPGYHTLESLKQGHGKTCKNMHRWSYRTEDAKPIVYEDPLLEYIKPHGNEFQVVSKKGKVLGTHPTKTAALKQLRAIEINKHNESVEGQDHEVSMAHNLLDSIIKSATELKGKMGTVEKDIPAWIQDHISQSYNFINQANSNYYDQQNVNESNEQRGYIDYAYDLKTKQLKRLGNGVASEYSIGMDLLFYYNRDQAKQIIAQNGVLKFREYPSMSEEEIKQELEQYISQLR